jgi:thiol-disulfide isomerase/thioredoxin
MNKSLFFLPLLLLSSFFSTAAEVGQPAPTCPAIFSRTNVSLDPSDYKGKVVLLDFWATWCPPCIKSMPFFNALHNELGKDGFEVVAINLDEDHDTVSAFLAEHKVNYPIAFDPQGECPKTYDVKAMPSSYLLDKSGIVRKIHLGFRDGDQALLREQIKSLLSQ